VGESTPLIGALRYFSLGEKRVLLRFIPAYYSLKRKITITVEGSSESSKGYRFYLEKGGCWSKLLYEVRD